MHKLNSSNKGFNVHNTFDTYWPYIHFHLLVLPNSHVLRNWLAISYFSQILLDSKPHESKYSSLYPWHILMSLIPRAVSNTALAHCRWSRNICWIDRWMDCAPIISIYFINTVLTFLVGHHINPFWPHSSRRHGFWLNQLAIAT